MKQLFSCFFYVRYLSCNGYILLLSSDLATVNNNNIRNRSSRLSAKEVNTTNRLSNHLALLLPGTMVSLDIVTPAGQRGKLVIN